jgi:hypothetical protein
MTKRTCSIEGCEQTQTSLGWCKKHYTRWRRHGNPRTSLRSQTPICVVEGCERPHKTRGWCGTHYERWRRNGDPYVNLWTGRTLAERFWPKVNKTETCWLWTAAKNHLGYGHIQTEVVGQRDMAHRVAWKLLVGPIPDGLELDHLCRTPSCVNPAHLEPVTHKENMRRAPWSAVDFQRAKTHCPQGHEYTPENTYSRPSRLHERACITCRRNRRSKRCSDSGSTGRAGS